jgi:hypothetical protein
VRAILQSIGSLPANAGRLQRHQRISLGFFPYLKLRRKALHIFTCNKIRYFYLPLDRRDSNKIKCLVVDTNNSRLLNKMKENWMLKDENSIWSMRIMLEKRPKFSPFRTSTSSSKQEAQTPYINNRVSPMIVKMICLLFDCGMHPKLLVPCMWNVGYFHRNIYHRNIYSTYFNSNFSH